MRHIIRPTGEFATGFGRALAALALVCALGMATGPALAQDRGHDDRGRPDARAPERHAAPEHRKREVRARPVARPAYGYDVPTYGSYPPPVVYAPPAPPAGISLIIPLRF
jgi:hypothetical protein